MNWDEPLKTKCEICGSNLFRKSGKRKITYCPNPNCKKQGENKAEENKHE
jgi:uncharacterized Zn finger protein (UPF0148 family)